MKEQCSLEPKKKWQRRKQKGKNVLENTFWESKKMLGRNGWGDCNNGAKKKFEKMKHRKTRQLSKFNFIRKAICQLLMGVMGNIKKRRKKFAQTLNCHVPWKNGELQKKRDTWDQNTKGQHEGAGFQDKKGRDPEGNRNTNYRSLQSPKNLICSQVGCRQPTSLGG